MFRSKNYTFQFCENKKYHENFTKTNFEYFDIYMDKKYILAYDLIFFKCHVGSNLSNTSSQKKKITHFNFIRKKNIPKILYEQISNFSRDKNIFYSFYHYLNTFVR